MEKTIEKRQVNERNTEGKEKIKMYRKISKNKNK